MPAVGTSRGGGLERSEGLGVGQMFRGQGLAQGQGDSGVSAHAGRPSSPPWPWPESILLENLSDSSLILFSTSSSSSL